jgi:hypothetical protein
MTSAYRTKLGKVTNTGELPRFIGLHPSKKMEGGHFPYRSITESLVAIFLEWNKDVRKMWYEGFELPFEPIDNLPALTCWPDFRVVLDGGEIEWVNAKYSRAGLRDEERAQLDLIDAHCARRNVRHRVVFREDLERNGFIGTIKLLRKYGSLAYRQANVSKALTALESQGATYLEPWQRRARAAGVPVDLLYFLLYHQQLPVLYRPLVHTGLQLCRV